MKGGGNLKIIFGEGARVQEFGGFVDDDELVGTGGDAADVGDRASL